MYCLVWRGQAPVENMAKFVQVFRDQLLPRVSRRSGFEGAYLLTKPDGSLVVLHLWENEEQSNTWRASPEREPIAAQLGSLITGMQQEESYEVQAQEIPFRMPFGHP